MAQSSGLSESELGPPDALGSAEASEPGGTEMGDNAPSLDVRDYSVTDPFFGAPYIDLDEPREEPVPHRHIHGGFEGTDTRFTFYFPPAEQYQGRLIQPLEGAHAGHEDAFGSALMGEMLGGLPLAVRLGGYMVESNMGHIGDDIDPKGGEDPTLYGHRAAAESARLSKFVAAQVYGKPPHHSYVWGGSGGGRRSPLCLENAPDAWDGALPFMGGGDIAEHGTKERMKGAQVMAFACMFNVQRILGDKIYDVVDAMQPGGSGDPFAGLTNHEREELACLYRLGYPRGDEYMIANPMGQIWLWTSIADMLQHDDADYFDAFWTKDGYVGHDMPSAVEGDLIDMNTTVSRVITAGDLLQDPEFDGPELTVARMMAGAAMMSPEGLNLALAIEVKGLPSSGYRMGAGLRMTSGPAAGRQLYCSSSVGDLFFADGHGEANLLRFSGVLAGDEVHVDNHAFLAFCYYHRHHVMEQSFFDHLRVDGRPIYQQHNVPVMSPLMGVAYSGQYKGKLLWVHHTHDASLWPAQGTVYPQAVAQAQGPDGLAERFCLRWSENAEHVPPAFVPKTTDRHPSTWLIDYLPIIEQSLFDLVDWVERDIKPVGTAYRYTDGKIDLPASADERGGIQPVVSVTANGGVRTEVPSGEPVTLEVTAEVPPNAGTIIGVSWDFDGSGAFSEPMKVDGADTSIKLSTTHTFDRPGTYFATCRVESHRDGDMAATTRRIPNLASARIIVT